MRRKKMQNEYKNLLFEDLYHKEVKHFMIKDRYQKLTSASHLTSQNLRDKFFQTTEQRQSILAAVPYEQHQKDFVVAQRLKAS